MDLRIEKTERAIKNAFIELRAKKTAGEDHGEGAVRGGVHQQIYILFPLCGYLCFVRGDRAGDSPVDHRQH